jgi:hypothetical protein
VWLTDDLAEGAITVEHLHIIVQCICVVQVAEPLGCIRQSALMAVKQAEHR